MKKVFLGLFIAALCVIGFTSCEKTCTCKSTTTNKVLDPSYYDYDEEFIAAVETPSTVTATGKYKGKCSDQNTSATQTTAYVQQTIQVVCQ